MMTCSSDKLKKLKLPGYTIGQCVLICLDDLGTNLQSDICISEGFS